MPTSKVSIEDFRARLDTVPEIEFARLAAFIDGEGCIGISNSPKRGYMTVRQHSMNVTVTNTNLRLFDWLIDTFGGSFCAANRNDEKNRITKPCYRWLINETQCEEILRRCLKFFILKREQAEIALMYRDLRNKRKEELHNIPVTEEELMQRDVFQQKISAINSCKGFGVKKAV